MPQTARISVLVAFILSGCASIVTPPPASLELPPRERPSAVEIWKQKAIEEKGNPKPSTLRCIFDFSPSGEVVSVAECEWEGGKYFGPVS